MRPSAYDPNQIGLARDLRKSGAGYRQIAKLTEMPMSTVVYYVRDIEPAKDGQKEVWVKVDDAIAIWQPGTPLRELPLPNWLLSYLKQKT